jgi:hypothetical protein
MIVSVVKVNWRWDRKGYIYGVLLNEGRTIVVWDNAERVHYLPVFALPRHERTDEEVEVPDDFIQMAHRFFDSQTALESWCPELLKQRSLNEQGGTRVAIQMKD